MTHEHEKTFLVLPSLGLSIYSWMEKSNISSFLLPRPLFEPCDLLGSEAELPHAAESCTDLLRAALLATITRALPAAAPS